MDALFWFSRNSEQEGVYHVNEYRHGKIEQLFSIEVKSNHLTPTINFPLDEIYLVGHGDAQFSLYAKTEIKMTAQIPEAPLGGDKPVLINHSKMTEDLGTLYIAATFINENKKVTVIYAKFDVNTGKCSRQGSPDYSMLKSLPYSKIGP